MAELKDKLKLLVQQAREKGLSNEEIKGYLTLTRTATGEHKNIMDTLLKENDIWMSEVINLNGMTIEEIMDVKERPEENIDQLSEKTKKLLEKIELLSQKIEEEKSPVKRHILSFQVKMLIAKIQREIDLQNLKSAYEDKRKFLVIEKEERENGAVDNIAILNSKIKALQREMNGNEEYDAESPYFMYPPKYVQELGGVENLIKKLKESQKGEVQQTAIKIDEMAQKRAELNKLYEELRTEQDNLEYSQEDYEQNKKDLNKEEKALMIRQKFNIFSRIGNFFKTMLEEAKLYRQEKNQIRDLKTKQKEDEKLVNEEFARRMQELKEEYEKEKQGLRESQQKEKEEQQTQSSKDIAADFRKKMAEMGKTESDVPVPQEPQQGDNDRNLEEPIVPTGEQQGEDR